MNNLIKTPLHQLHLDLGAKMVPFAGYSMPVQYKSGIIKEHLHCREQVGFFDISHMGQLHISGVTAADELEKLTPGDIKGLAIGQQRYLVLTNELGGIIDDVIVTKVDDGFLLVVNAACKTKDINHLQQYLSAQCKLTLLDDKALFALQGPLVENIMQQLCLPASQLSFMQACSGQLFGMDCFISRCGYTGEDGFEISIVNQDAVSLAEQLLALDGVQAIGLGARDTLRLEAGLSLYGHELNETISLVEAGLKWTFRKQASNFLGAKLIQAQIQSGTTNKSVGLIAEGKIPVRAGTELFDSQDNKVGQVSSGNFSPSLSKPIALALINSQFEGTELYAYVRKSKIQLTISELPFVPHQFKRT